MIVLEGALSVKAALKYGRRPVEAVLLDERKEMTKDLDYIKRQCEMKKVPFKRVSAAEIASLTTGKTHGGLIAQVLARTTQSLESVLKKENGFILLLEGIEDPFNLGQIFRTAALAGVDAILMAKRDLEFAQSTLMKSSAGLFDAIDWVTVDDLPQALAYLRTKGYTFAITYRNERSIEYLDADFTGNLVLGIGGEMRGLSTAVMAQSDLSVMISYPTDLKVALNAVSATAVLCFEVVRQRRKPL